MQHKPRVKHWRLFVVAPLLALTLAVQARAQEAAISSIGGNVEFLWGFIDTMYTSMTPDGSWIAFVEGRGNGCFTNQLVQRISMIRPDGTDYRIVVDWPVIDALPSSGKAYILGLVISPDASLIWFRRADDSFQCQEFGPVHNFFVDTATGSVTEFTFNGFEMGNVSFTDDGSSMAFQGFEPEDGTWGYYIAEPGGSGAVRFLDSAPWLAVIGTLSGDGSKFLFIGLHGGFPFPADVYVYDFATDLTRRLSRDTLPYHGASISAEGVRVVYHEWGGPLHQVLSDGSNHTIIDGTVIGAGTGDLTRDGSTVFFAGVDMQGANKSFTIPWNGTAADVQEVAPTSFAQSLSWMERASIDAQGSKLAYPRSGFLSKLTVSFLDLPVLTSYGYATPGTPMTFDVGGHEGDSYSLLFAVLPLGPLQGSYQAFGLPPNVLPILFDPVGGPGTVLAPDNVGSVTLNLPPGLYLPEPIEVSFWALVDDGSGAPPKTTNVTTVSFQQAAPSMLSAPLPPALRASMALSSGAPRRAPDLTRPLSAEELTRMLVLQDPGFAARLGER